MARLCPVVARALAAQAFLAGACRSSSALEAPAGQVSEGQAARLIEQATRRSTQGVVVLPSSKAERFYDTTRLNEIAQVITEEAARCFIGRALVTLRRVEHEGEPVYVGVPDGQLRIRVRILPDGSVADTEIRTDEMRDGPMRKCVEGVVAGRRWPESRRGVASQLDVVYWVRLGAQGDFRSAAFRGELRRQEAAAGVKAETCLAGRVAAGTYRVEGLSLMGADGETLANRVEPGSVPEEVAGCVARAYHAIRIPPAEGTFVRPISPVVTFEVAADGTVRSADKDWLRLIEIEERAVRAAAEEPKGGGATPPAPAAPREDEAGGEGPAMAGGPSATPAPAAGRAPGGAAREDPAKAGIKLDLTGLRRGSGGD